MGITRMKRSRDAVAGGVCAGFAERLDVDPAVVRIFCVLLCIMTAGVGVIAYAVLWVVLPKEPEPSDLLDVSPHEVASETYGAGVSPPSSCASSASSAASRGVYAVSAHEPPTPPLAARAAATAVASHLEAGGSVQHLPSDFAASFDAVTATPEVSAGVVPAEPKRSAISQLPRPVKTVILWACFAVAFVGLLRLLGFVVQGAEWWRFWPLFFSLSGVSVIAVPGKPTLRMAHAMTGVSMLAAGTVVLPMSVGLVAWASLIPWLMELWPVLLLAVICLTVGWTRRSWPWALAGGLLFSAFCVGGLLLFAEPGPVQSVIVSLPFSRDLVFSYPF